MGTDSYFRIQYDTENIALLTSQLLHNNSVLPKTARALFLDDTVALAVRRMVSIDALVGFLTYLCQYAASYTCTSCLKAAAKL
ncbi:hypothetical protein V5799_002879 [Amblyomma americanum]|uniref:Uncharacterized protein n=1 Tax=Amblyomma americanum TaxID=6943 RepID=A0AAQ4DAK0_AMBAM